jgi:hypothetical protein
MAESGVLLVTDGLGEALEPEGQHSSGEDVKTFLEKMEDQV